MVDRFRVGNLGEIVVRKDSVFTIFMRFFSRERFRRRFDGRFGHP
jgi:hypothetical protein